MACNVRRGNEKGRVERPIGFVRERFWPGRRFADLLDLNRQGDRVARRRSPTTASTRSRARSQRSSSSTKRNAALRPLPQTPFETDDKQSSMVTKSFRVRFDRNSYSVPWNSAVRPSWSGPTTPRSAVFLGPKQVASHARCWDAGKDLKLDSHEQGLLEQKPGADKGRLPPALVGLGQRGEKYFKVFSANGRSIAKETIRLTLLTELFDDGPTASAIEEVMATGHVGAEYVEYVLRHKRGLTPSPPPLRLGDPMLDAISLREPDLSVYDRLPQKTLDPEAK